jgi:hypothetical protein
MHHTPNDIEVLIHYYASGERHPRVTAPAVQETLEQYCKDGIFERLEAEPFFRVTEKGEAWLRMIIDTPYPKKQWIDPRT